VERKEVNSEKMDTVSRRGGGEGFQKGSDLGAKDGTFDLLGESARKVAVKGKKSMERGRKGASRIRGRKGVRKT